MSGWFSRLFRSRAEVLAEKAEVDGQFDDAARLYIEGGARAEAVRVLTRAAESSKHLADRRGFLTRAYALATTDELRIQVKKALGLVTLAEAEASPPRDGEERMRLCEAAADLEAAGAFREALAAYRLLGDRGAIERVLMLAGDIEGYEREAGAGAERERYALRRRHAIESLEALWRSGDRVSALSALQAWVRDNAADVEARALYDARRGQLVYGKSFRAQLNGEVYMLAGVFPVVLGRDGDVVLRGASVSREHCVIEHRGGAFLVRDNGSRNGTQVQGVTLAGEVPLAIGQAISLGRDLVFLVEDCNREIAVLRVEQGMDRGRRAVLIAGAWPMPMGTLRFVDKHVVLEPRGVVLLLGQRIVATMTLAFGDRVEGDGAVLEVLRAV